MIQFISEYPNFTIVGKKVYYKWISEILSKNSYSSGTITYLFTTDTKILQINSDFLGHNYPTDIITFPLESKSDKLISADIVISLDTVKDNASYYGKKYFDEFLRVVAHGVLHLIGFNDKTNSEREIMNQEEDKCIDLFYLLNANSKYSISF